MPLARNITILAPLLFILFGYHVIQNNQVQVVTGTILSDKTGKPVANAHVYVIDGEEEALTNTKGEFSIRTAQKLPVPLTVEHKDHHKVNLPVTNILQKQVIRLQARVP